MESSDASINISAYPVPQKSLAQNFTANPANTSQYPPLDVIEEEYFLQNSPIVVSIFAVFSVIGVTGNISSIAVYATSEDMKKRAVRVFIIWLSATDLIASAIIIPFEIVELRHPFTFTSSGVCKAFRYLGHVVSFSSCAFLMTIAVERWTILRKRKPRVDIKPAKLSNLVSLGIIVLACLISIPFCIYFGINEIPVPHYPSVTAHECSAKLDSDGSEKIVAYAIVMGVLTSCFFLVIVVLYGRILFEFHKNKANCKRPAGKTSYEISECVSSKTETGENEIITVHPSRETTKSPKTDKYESAWQLTITLITMTGVSAIGYFTYIATAVVVFVINPAVYNSCPQIYDILLRAFFVNNVVNPVIYVIMDSVFRHECLAMYRNCFEKMKPSQN